MTDTPQTNYDKWRRHFNNMIEGKLASDRKVILVNDRQQVGKGLEIVSPIAQTVEMARAIVKTPRNRAIKRRRAASQSQSKAKRSKKQVKRKKKSYRRSYK